MSGLWQEIPFLAAESFGNQIFDETASGGMSTGGTSTINVTASKFMLGGCVTGGSITTHFIATNVASGGCLVSGLAQNSIVYHRTLIAIKTHKSTIPNFRSIIIANQVPEPSIGRANITKKQFNVKKIEV